MRNTILDPQFDSGWDYVVHLADRGGEGHHKLAIMMVFLRKLKLRRVKMERGDLCLG